MLEEGAFDAPIPEVVFGLHVFLSLRPFGTHRDHRREAIDGRRRTACGSFVRGKQTHKGRAVERHRSGGDGGPDRARLQTVVSRQSDLHRGAGGRDGRDDQGGGAAATSSRTGGDASAPSAASTTTMRDDTTSASPICGQ